jgi:hypothetical protein
VCVSEIKAIENETIIIRQQSVWQRREFVASGASLPQSKHANLC